MTMTTMQFAGNLNRVLATLDTLGIEPPMAIEQARAAYDTAMRYHGPDAVDSSEAFNAHADEITDLIDRAADVHVQRAAVLAVRGAFIDRLAGRGQVALGQNTDALLTAAAPIVRPAMAKFGSEFRKLPTGWEDAQRLIETGGPSAVTTLQTCQRLAVTLDAARELRRHLPGTDVPGAVGVGATYASCADTLVAAEVCGCNGQGTLGFWGQVLSVEGVDSLVWHATVAEHRAAVAALPNMQMIMAKDGIGARPMKVPAR